MTLDPRVQAVAEITTAHLFDIVIDLNPRLNIGSGPFGQRILFGAWPADRSKARGYAARCWRVAVTGRCFRPDGAMTLTFG